MATPFKHQPTRNSKTSLDRFKRQEEEHMQSQKPQRIKTKFDDLVLHTHETDTICRRTLRELARYWGYKPQKKIFGEFLEFHLTYIQSNLVRIPWTVQTNIASYFWRQIIYRYGQRWNAVVWCDQCEKYTLLWLDITECRILGCSNLTLIAEGLFREVAEYGDLVTYLPDGWRRPG
jgi:hypothetical protein